MRTSPLGVWQISTDLLTTSAENTATMSWPLLVYNRYGSTDPMALWLDNNIIPRSTELPPTVDNITWDSIFTTHLDSLILWPFLDAICHCCLFLSTNPTRPVQDFLFMHFFITSIRIYCTMSYSMTLCSRHYHAHHDGLQDYHPFRIKISSLYQHNFYRYTPNICLPHAPTSMHTQWSLKLNILNISTLHYPVQSWDCN